jgi:MFS family permease
VGYFVCGTLGNRYGRREMSALFLIIGGFAGVLFLVVGTSTLTELAAFYGFYYFFSIGQMGSAPGFVAEVFPTRVRGTGMALLVAAASGGFIIASATGPATMATFGYGGALFLWCGLASFVAAAMALGTRRIRPGLDLEAISI